MNRKIILRKIIAQNVKRLRLKHRYTREKLSILCEKDTSYISKLEKENVNITVDTLEKIAQALKVNPLELLQERR